MKKLILFAVLLLCSSLFAQNRDIPVTRDLNPDAVYDTYQDWVAKNPPQKTNAFEVSRMHSNQRDEGFLIIVNNDLYENIEQSLLVYQQDLADDGFNSYVVVFDGTSPIDLKQEILLYVQLESIVNVVLIGNLPVAWFELFEDWNDNGIQDPGEDWVEFPCDLYFTDIDGIWGDFDEDGILDYHGGEQHPELGIGRIVADNMDMLDASEYELVNSYFQRNHLFRSGVITSNNISLAYIDDDWASWGNDYQQSMLLAYPSVELVNDIEETNAGDYLNNRLISDYELIQVHVHSGPDAHYFYYNAGTNYQLVHNYEVAAINPTAHFYNLFACSNSRYTTSNNMGGMYIYGSEHGLVTLGSTKTGSMLGFTDFYHPLSEDKTFGESLRLWWELNVDTAPYSGWERAWFYGMIIQGDPSLRRRYNKNSGIFAYFEADEYVGLTPHMVHFTDLSVPPDSIVSWQWDFQNDGIIDSYEQNPSYSYADSGSFSVSLTVSDAHDSTDTEIRENYIRVDIPLVNNITQHTGYGTIQDGIDCANEGDVIILEENCYFENINFNGKNITLASKYFTEQDTSYISQTILDGNNADAAVKIINGEDSTAVLMGLTIRNGHSSTGGGICIENSSPSLFNLKILENSATSGGGIFYQYSYSTIKNSIISNNSSVYYGGGVFCNKSSPNFVNVTVEGNSSAYQGGGISCYNSSAPVLTNTIFWNNNPQEIYFSGILDPNEITINYSDIQGGVTGITTNNNGAVHWLFGNINADPLFADPLNGDYHLSWLNYPIPDSTKSPCIDAGDPSSPLDPDGTIADMGAYYFNQNVSVDEPQGTSRYMLTNYPNPIGINNNNLSVSFSILKPGSVKIQLFNIKGQLVSTLINEDKNTGNHIITHPIEMLSSGIYFTKLTIDGVVKEVSKVVVLR